MSSEWINTTLGAVTKWSSGGTPKKGVQEFWGGTIPWISASSMYENRIFHSETCITEKGLENGSRLAKKESILLLVRGSALHSRLPVGMAMRDVAFNQDVKALQANKRILRPWFLLYWLMSKRDFLLESVVEFTGIGAGKLDTERMQGLEFQLPSIEDQDRILKIIKPLDDLIGHARAQNFIFEDIAQRLFRSWFVNFDPVHAKAAGKEPEAMSAELAALFPSEFEESAIGLIPKGWTVTTFGDCLTHTIGGDWGKDIADEKYTKAVRVIRGTDIPDLLASKSSSVPARFVQPSKLNQRALHPFDLVIEVSGGSRDQSTGRSLMVTRSMISELGGAVVPTSFCRLFRPATQELGVILGCRLAWHYKVGNMWGYQVQSTGIANFQTTYFLSNDKMALPPEELQKKFKEIVAPMLESSYNPVIRALGQLRDHLLPRLISGKLSLSDAEATLASVKPAVERA